MSTRRAINTSTLQCTFQPQVECNSPGYVTSAYHRWSLLAPALAAVLMGAIISPASGQPNLTIEPITWNIIGLDSNDVTDGPEDFPVGARVRNLGSAAATNLTVTLELGTGTGVPYISVADLDKRTSPTLAPGDVADFYFTVRVARNVAAYDKARLYRIAAEASNHAIIRTPTNRELYVEHLVSQNRNQVLQLLGPPSISKGEVRTFILFSSTATQGYGQLETFVNFPNDIFQVESVIASYTAGTTPIDKIYADACLWENNTADPDYRSCNGSGKAGGDIITTYTVSILQDITEDLNLKTLIYDFSGSSYHYNSAFGIDLTVPVVDADIAVVKTATDDPVEAGSPFQYMLTAMNVGDSLAEDVIVSDTLPLGVNFVNAVPPPTSGPNPLIWEAGDLAVGQSKNFTINVTAGCTSGPVTNLVTVSTITTETTLANNISSDTITILESTPPQIFCPTDITTNTEPGVCDAAVDYVVTATDNCVTVTVETSPPPGSRFPLGTTDVTSTATDDFGNQASCTFKVTVEDNTPPQIECPSDITTSTEPGVCDAVVTFEVGATDNCNEVSVVSAPPSGSRFPLGTTDVISTATDEAGNETTCTFKVTVEDNTPPQIECPSDITTNTEPGVCDAIVTFVVDASDLCSDVTVVSAPPSGSRFPLGTTDVVSTATDEAGNETTCTFKVTVEDNVPPQIQCPSDITTSTDAGVCDSEVTFLIDASDLCSDVTVVSSPPSGSRFPLGTTDVVSTATDEAGNETTCTFKVTVEDNTPPQIQCPSDITTSTDTGVCDSVVTFLIDASDLCSDVTVVSSPASGSKFPLGTTDVVSTATDEAGNETTCTVKVTVEDNTSPQIECPADITTSTEPGVCDAVVTFEVGATDNCNRVTVVSAPPSGSRFPLGTTDVVSTATDDAGNETTCTFQVTVEDNTPPQIQCPSNITTATDTGECDALVEYIVEAADLCSEVTVESSPPSGTRFPLGSTDVVSTATDAAGNTATCTFTVTVLDETKPTITCPTDVEATIDVCQTSVTLNIPRPEIADDCSTTSLGPAVRSDGRAITASFFEGLTLITWTVIDAAGNQATCTSRVQVNANTEACHCNLTQGYWKTHPEAWPVNSLTLGNVVYTKAQCLRILNKSVKGNGLIALAHQLIAAKLNIIAGSDPSAVAVSIAAADALIGNKVIPPIGGGKLKTVQTSALVSILDQYNRGLLGVPHCDGLEPVIAPLTTSKKR